MRSLGFCGASSLLLAGARAFHAAPGYGRFTAVTSNAAATAFRTSCPSLPSAPGARWSARSSRVGQRRLRMEAAAGSKKEESEEPTGHQPPPGMPKTMSPEEIALTERIKAHQETAARLTKEEEVRNLVQYSTGFGVISTNSKNLDGYPSGSVVGFGLDDIGRPLFAFSSMSAHTGDLLSDSRMCITITAAGFQGAADGRVSMIGDVHKVPEEERAAIREMYKVKHPKAYWVDFGDFSLMRMDTIKAIRFVGGFAMAGNLSPEVYLSTPPDPVAEFSKPILTHMNDDHPETTKAMVEHYITGGVKIQSAMISAVDRLGMYVVVVLPDGQSGKLRLPFPRPANERKDVKNLIVEMTQAAAAAAQAKG